MSWSETLRSIRESADLSQRELGERLDMSHANIGHIERGTNRASLEVADQWARQCGYRLTFEPIDDSDDDEGEIFSLTALFMRVVRRWTKRQRSIERVKLEAELGAITEAE